jgi:hypothetical protein
MKVINLLFLLFIGCSTPQYAPYEIGVSQVYNQLSQCYLKSDSYKKRKNEEKREMQVRYLVTKEGQVQNFKVVKTDFKDPGLEACVKAQFLGLKFEPREIPAEVNQPINFHTGEP